MLSSHPHQSLYAMVKDRNVNRLSVNHRKTMSWLSRAIELSALNAAAPLRIHSSFQSMQFFLPVIERYKKLGERAAVFVYGYPDITPPPIEGIAYVPLGDDDPLIKEWFIIVNGPDFCNALITEEQSALPNTPHLRRIFKGMLTYEREMVQRMDDALSQQNDVPLPTRHYATPAQRALIMHMVGHLQDATRRMSHDPVVLRELSAIINQYITPALN